MSSRRKQNNKKRQTTTLTYLQHPLLHTTPRSLQGQYRQGSQQKDRGGTPQKWDRALPSEEELSSPGGGGVRGPLAGGGGCGPTGWSGGPGPSSWELIINANSRPHPDLQNQKLWGGASTPGDSDVTSGREEASLLNGFPEGQTREALKGRSLGRLRGEAPSQILEGKGEDQTPGF